MSGGSTSGVPIDGRRWCLLGQPYTPAHVIGAYALGIVVPVADNGNHKVACTDVEISKPSG